MAGQETFDIAMTGIVGIGGGMLSIIAFFIRQLLSKITRLGETITELDKKMAVLINDNKGHTDRFQCLEERIKELEAKVWGKHTLH
tara:strand:+ start:251 stop:508 length:258 start_codon:yes stop_codon:yes gene_type:complete